MMTDTKISLAIGSSTFYFDSFTESFGSAVSQTPSYSGIYRVITGALARKLVFKGRLTRDSLSSYEALGNYAGTKTNITADGVTYSGYALESAEFDFKAGALMGDVTAVFTEVN